MKRFPFSVFLSPRPQNTEKDEPPAGDGGAAPAPAAGRESEQPRKSDRQVATTVAAPEDGGRVRRATAPVVAGRAGRAKAAATMSEV